MKSLDALEVPLYYTKNSAPATKREFHIFPDATEKAISGIDISMVSGIAKVALS